MGYLSDLSDVARIMRSPEGQARLEGIRASLAGRTIVAVEFTNETHTISILLLLDDGDTFLAMDPSLDVDVLRADFEDVIHREHLLDYPDRRADAVTG